MLRRAFMMDVGTVIAGSFGTEAQQSTRVPRVGVLHSGSSAEPSTVQREPFERALRDLGWVPGASIVIVNRFAEGQVERLPDLANELVRLNVDVIVTRAVVATLAARQATSRTPIVMSAVPDPVRSGFVANLARPGGHITGLAWLAEGEIEGKQLQLLKEAVPGLRRVAILQNPAAYPDTSGPLLEPINAAARSLGLEAERFDVSTPEDLAEAFAAMPRAGVGALLARGDALMLDPHWGQIAQFALKYRLPAIYPWRQYVEAGGLMSFNTSIPEFHYRSASDVDKILKGAKPGDLPIEQPTKFELVINLKTAKVLGLTIPQSRLLRADHLIQ